MSTGTEHRGIDPAYPDAREAPAFGPLSVNGPAPPGPMRSTSASSTASRSRGCAAASRATRTTSSRRARRRARTRRPPTRESPARSWSGPASSCSAIPARTAARTGRSGAGTRSTTAPGTRWRRRGPRMAPTSSSAACARTSTGSIEFLRAEATRLDLEPEALGCPSRRSLVVGRTDHAGTRPRQPEARRRRLRQQQLRLRRTPRAPLWNNRRDRSEMCSDNTYDRSPGDPLGEICPYAAHIRKAYPRDDVRAALRLRRRLLRRGIPFGQSSRSTPRVPVNDGIDRGLLFMAYMTSIVDQFEYVTRNWINKPDFKTPNAGVDAILGQVRCRRSSPAQLQRPLSVTASTG